jgi:hypothetical protein
MKVKDGGRRKDEGWWTKEGDGWWTKDEGKGRMKKGLRMVMKGCRNNGG